MTLRFRLTLWYAGLTSVIVISIALLAYIAHGRTQYLDVDRALAEEAAYLAPLFVLAPDAETAFDIPSTDELQTFVRLYNDRGESLADPGADLRDPPLDALETIAAPSGPAFDRALRWLPSGEISAAGVFATADHGANRTRLYAQPVLEDERVVGYVLTWTSLAGIDRSISRFRWLMFGGSALAVAAVWTGGLTIAGAALRPLRRTVATATGIANSGRFDRRVAASTRQDELGQLSRVFNEMLDALEDSYRAQQRFVADAAHELRAPLTVIRGNVELLSRVPAMSPEDQQEALAHLTHEVTRLHALIDELLTLARTDAGQTLTLQPVELDELLLRIVAEFSGAIGRERVTVAGIEPIVVAGDRDRLHQLLTILIDNALKYSAPEDSVCVDLRTDHGSARLAICDQGVGIPAEALPHIFERFYRADQARGRDPGGSGLGLAIAEWIVGQHHGEIIVESEEDVGSEFTVWLPLETLSAATLDPDEPRHRASS